MKEEELLKSLEERINILEFKQELALKIIKSYSDETTDGLTMDEFAYINNLNKEEYESVNKILPNQISIYEAYKSEPYDLKRSNRINSRQLIKELNPIVFDAYVKEQFENEIWKCIPKYKDNHSICETIAKINGIHELYYGILASEIIKSKAERVDKEIKLKQVYLENKEIIDNLFNDIDLMYKEIKQNLNNVNSVLKFFEEKNLVQMNLFYNGELWEKTDGNKQVVINEDSYINKVCVIKEKDVCNKLEENINNKDIVLKDLVNFLLNVGNSSSVKKVTGLSQLYTFMKEFNKSNGISVTDLNNLKEKLEQYILIVDEVMKFYYEYIM